MLTYLDNIFRAFSQALNTIFFFGDSQESISARCWRKQWNIGIKIINTMFFWQNNHCRGAYSKDVEWAKSYINQPVKEQ
jgi:hypothetical protein